mmetsp:Transcript_1909/g.3717  ORF Transcript_1909/g.3717 Transcript_1909/m.3717 type:complete len:295 (-) Transcript_1909:485-1369(-)
MRMMMIIMVMMMAMIRMALREAVILVTVVTARMMTMVRRQRTLMSDQRRWVAKRKRKRRTPAAVAGRRTRRRKATMNWTCLRSRCRKRSERQRSAILSRKKRNAYRARIVHSPITDAVFPYRVRPCYILVIRNQKAVAAVAVRKVARIPTAFMHPMCNRKVPKPIDVPTHLSFLLAIMVVVVAAVVLPIRMRVNSNIDLVIAMSTSFGRQWYRTKKNKNNYRKHTSICVIFMALMATPWNRDKICLFRTTAVSSFIPWRVPVSCSIWSVTRSGIGSMDVSQSPRLRFIRRHPLS